MPPAIPWIERRTRPTRSSGSSGISGGFFIEDSKITCAPIRRGRGESVTRGDRRRREWKLSTSDLRFATSKNEWALIWRLGAGLWQSILRRRSDRDSFFVRNGAVASVSSGVGCNRDRLRVGADLQHWRFPCFELIEPIDPHLAVPSPPRAPSPPIPNQPVRNTDTAVGAFLRSRTGPLRCPAIDSQARSPPPRPCL